MTECEHRDVIEDPTMGCVCTGCGTVLDTSNFLCGSGDEVQCSRVAERPGEARIQRLIPEFTKRRRELARLVDSVVSSMGIHEAVGVGETARVILDDLLKTPGFQARDSLVVAAGIVYYALKIRGIARSPQEICVNAGVDKRLFTKSNNVLRKALGNTRYSETMSDPVTSRDLVERYMVHIMRAAGGPVDRIAYHKVRRLTNDLLETQVAESRDSGTRCAGAIGTAMVARGLLESRRAVALVSGISGVAQASLRAAMSEFSRNYNLGRR